MICPDHEGLSAHLDGEDAGLPRDEIERHVESCPACRRTLQAMRAAQAALRAHPVPAMPRDLAERLSSLSPSPEGRAPLEGTGAGPFNRRSVMALAFAACLAIAVWSRREGILAARLELPADLLMAAHNQYALTMPLAPSERIMTEMPVRLAGSRFQERDVY